VLAADAILLLDHGRIVERGRHSDLVAADGLYTRLYERRFAPEAQGFGERCLTRSRSAADDSVVGRRLAQTIQPGEVERQHAVADAERRPAPDGPGRDQRAMATHQPAGTHRFRFDGRFEVAEAGSAFYGSFWWLSPGSASRKWWRSNVRGPIGTKSPSAHPSHNTTKARNA
jgi:hypothetical protein